MKLPRRETEQLRNAASFWKRDLYINVLREEIPLLIHMVILLPSFVWYRSFFIVVKDLKEFN